MRTDKLRPDGLVRSLREAKVDGDRLTEEEVANFCFGAPLAWMEGQIVFKKAAASILQLQGRAGGNENVKIFTADLQPHINVS